MLVLTLVCKAVYPPSRPLRPYLIPLSLSGAFVLKVFFESLAVQFRLDLAFWEAGITGVRGRAHLCNPVLYSKVFGILDGISWSGSQDGDTCLVETFLYCTVSENDLLQTWDTYHASWRLRGEKGNVLSR